MGAVVLFGSAPQAASGVEKLTLDMVGQTDILMNNFTQVLDAVDNAVALLQSAEETQASMHCRLKRPPSSSVHLGLGPTLCFVPSGVMFCKAFFTCSTGCWADTAATVQSSW